MKIAFCSSEVFPFAKTGGLADVSGVLPFALAGSDCQVKVFMPFYKNIQPQQMHTVNTELGVLGYGYTKRSPVEFYFINKDEYFRRDYLYGTPSCDYPDNLERFSFYSKAVCALLKQMDFCPDIIHSNDWQASLVNIYLKTLYRDDEFFKDTRSILTIHNLAYQGLFSKDKYPLLGIPWDYFTLDYLEYYGKINLLKGGIISADIVNTVSPTYAKQIQTPDYGCGLDGVLREKRQNLFGILNAIDYKVWNPRTDKFIYQSYSSGAIEEKHVNKKKFQKELGLKTKGDTLLLGMVSRLADQKGVDILTESLDYLLKK